MPDIDRCISHNVAAIAVSAIKEMVMRSAGVPDVASLTWGLPSFRTPAGIREAAAEALAEDPDIGKYALPDGLPELRAAAAAEHLRATGITVDADRNVLVSAGNMQALNALLHTVIDPADEIILTDPGFASHLLQIRLCGGRPVAWPLDESRGWSLDVDRLPQLINAKTKAILLVSPSNPTGSIFDRQDLLRVGAIAEEHGLLILLDDPYSSMTYENQARYFNLAAAPDYAERVAYCYTFSKMHAMSGWRVGYLILSEALKRQVIKVHDATLICTPRVSQVAALAALRGEQRHVAEFQRVLARRRRLICERLDRVPHVFEYVQPQGAYYVFPHIVSAHENSHEFAIRLLERARVTVTPGAAFGRQGEHHVRMAFCVADDVINLAFDRIEALFGHE